MNKNIIFLIAGCLLMLQTTMAQNVNLKFTGATNNGKYVQLDSVKVENISRSWTETLYYPDTILTLTNTTSISDMENSTVSACLSYPNPFNGTSNIALALPQSGNVSLQVYNITGQQIMAKNLYMESGENHLEISLQHPQVYLLVAHTANSRFIQKLINTGHSNGNNIVYIGTLPNQEKAQVKTQKLLSQKEFHSGDVLKMTGYATHDGNIWQSWEIRRPQMGSEDITLSFVLNTNEAPFSVSATNKVFFSPGNLQWSATNGGTTETTHNVAGGNTAAGTWQFTDNQLNIIGRDNSNISSSYSGWIDLFGYGTSGYDNKYPYLHSINSTDFYDGDSNITDTYYDWGVYNAIYNPKTNMTDAPGTWRTLTKDEWDYMLNTRTTTSGVRFAMGIVNDIPGLIVLPDNWNTTIYTLNDVNTAPNKYFSNIINVTDWATILEKAGAVFLPAAGYRHETSVYALDYNEPGPGVFYWSSTKQNAGHGNAYALCFRASFVFLTDGCFNGNAVRLVRSAE